MLFRKKESEYLDKEKDIYNYLSKGLRIFRYLLRIHKRKERIVKKIAKHTKSLLDFREHGLIRRVFRRRQIFEKKVEILKALFSDLLSQIKRQKLLLLEDIRISDKEEDLIEHIENMPLFNSVNSQEKALLEELVYKEKEKIDNLLRYLRTIFRTLRSQEKLINDFSFDGSRKDELVNEAQKVVSTTIKIHDWQEKAILVCMNIVEDLIKISKETIEKNKHIEEFFNPEDLKEIMSLINYEIRRERNKTGVLLRFLQEQRQIRNSLHVRNLIAVHKTDYFPDGGIIKVKGHHKFTFETNPAMWEFHKIKPRFDKFEFQGARNTLHFTLNGPVTGHLLGNWEHCKYGILVPLHLFIDRVIVLKPVDTFIFGDLILPPGSEIIGKYKDIVEKNPGHAKIVTIGDDEDLDKEIKRRIEERGYTSMLVGDRRWVRPEFQFESFSDYDKVREITQEPISGVGNFEEFAAKMK